MGIPSEVTDALAPLLAGADHVDVKTVRTEVPLRAFLAAMFSFQPAWVTLLYRVRAGFVRLLGMKQEGMPVATRMTAEQVPMEVGQRLSFFTVSLSSPGVWAAGADDRHLRATLAVVEGRQDGQRCLHGVTIVHYVNWAGPVYFNVIRPFHHLVVRSMMNSGARV